ncbi:MAG: 4Fe-4S binding protein [Cyclobacteriaceae bacterium]
MKIIKNTGLILFLLANMLLIILLFVGKYSLTANKLNDELGDYKHMDLVMQEFRSMLDQVYHSKFRFIEQIKENFEAVNQAILQEYKITQADVDKLIDTLSTQNGNITFDQQVIEHSFPGNNELTAFKKKQITDYTGWLQGRSFDSKDELKNQLLATTENINQGIISQAGFSNDRVKTLQFTLTKAANTGFLVNTNLILMLLTIGLGVLGAFMYILPGAKSLPGIKHNGIFHSSNKNKGIIGITIGLLFILFYVILYWYPEYMTEWVLIVDPLSFWIKNEPASQWFFYGLLYTLAILVMGVRMFIKYRHSKYHIIRTSSVMFFQLAFAFLIPEILLRLNRPSMDLKNIWPLNYNFFFDYNLEQLTTGGALGTFMLIWGIMLAIIAVPVLSYFYGKRWYCSWVCGCGGLAETLGDPYRQLSDKSLKAWQVERWMIHSILVLVTLMTIGTIYTYLTQANTIAGINTYHFRELYGFIIGAAFAGVVGVGFYPLMGNRVWCRFGCPLAAYLGFVQRFKSRFRITTNGGQCISCGNCSTYCEMGIDVRWYAQRGQNIIRSSCVGCGVCSSVCPRGVLKLENKDEKGRFGEPILIGNDGVKAVN